MGEQIPPFRTLCRACEFLHCIELKGDGTDGRRIRNIDDDEVVYPERVLECPVLHQTKPPEYMLWVLGWLGTYCGPIRVISGDEV